MPLAGSPFGNGALVITVGDPHRGLALDDIVRGNIEEP